MGNGTLRVFNHDTLAPGAVWPMHPHRDVEGITYVVAGHFEHADSISGGGVLEAGGVQHMTHGWVPSTRGAIIHRPRRCSSWNCGFSRTAVDRSRRSYSGSTLCA